MNKFRLLNADEIECRIAQVEPGYITLLLYKTARTDANLLDDTVGPENWENDFKIVDGVLYGGIGIRTESGMVWKWDAGTESNTEAEKGRASDAFKRAGFKWGIGRELYTAPFIKIGKELCYIFKDERSGKLKCYDKFEVSEISYNDKREITNLVIINSKTRAEVFKMGNCITPNFRDEVSEKISKKEAVILKSMLDKKNVNIPKLLEQSNVSSLEELTSRQYSNILEKLNG